MTRSLYQKVMSESYAVDIEIGVDLHDAGDVGFLVGGDVYLTQLRSGRIYAEVLCSDVECATINIDD